MLLEVFVLHILVEPENRVETSYLYHKYVYIYPRGHYSYKSLTPTTDLITPPILPPVPPPLLPKPTIKHRLSQLPIHLIMCLTHPPSKLLPASDLRLVAPTWLGHPISEILSAHPAGVQLRKDVQKGAHFGLLGWSCGVGVCGSERVQEGPG